MDYKWYSNNLSAEEAATLEKDFAKIELAYFGVNDLDELCLTLGIQYASRDCHTTWELCDMKDVRALLKKTKAMTVERLVGKVIETVRKDGSLRALSVNANLV